MHQIAQRKLDKVNALLDTRKSNNDTFFKGRLGQIFYFYHLYKVTGNISLKHHLEELLSQVFANVSTTNPTLIGPSISTGGAGLGYVVNFLCQEGALAFDINKEFGELDNYLFNAASDLIAKDNIDFLHGALGVLYYFGERARTSAHASNFLNSLTEDICRRAVRVEGGYWFRNNLIRVDDNQIINFSLSHGLCGILLVLISIYEVSAHRELIEETVKEGVRFILKHKMDVDFSNNEYAFFPFMIKDGASEISAPNEMGWGYGDLNEVLLFYRAGKMLNDKTLIQLADLIGMQSVMRKDSTSNMVTGTSFCHGAAGLAQFFKTLYMESNCDAYRKGYEYWIEQLILLLDDELENGTYTGKENDYLEGLTGPAFTLLSYVSELELGWSKVLLL
ncbi:Lanthionine synthetase C-like protein [Chitinophaga sp. CF118]|uniref:lanthionine synthetase LanC family protein n=1 Tax=Chitinophaga sp. CF118 TaxID=1884367 RepID=UPI0008E1F70B|nr:lanthionine synthetase LanC family protein [Chitinophaga sp. CF118]SFF04003.1 Lanthionine synthetase C-like protein [Chitinophaga sp. CF118]